MALTNASFSEILDDLSSRFIINVPEEELASVERICFQIEQAHWFYEDFVREQNPNLPSFTLKNFSAQFFKHCPLLHQWSHEHEKAFADFMQYKIRVPVCGAIMLNDTMDQCVLVKGWSSRSGWGFPKGKINKDEPDSTCAAREVLEETGYDISPLIREDDYLELTIREQRIRLYIVVGVSLDTEFIPRTRKEISKIEWHKLSELPTWIKSKDRDSPYNCGGGCVKFGSSRFYMVVPFVGKLRHWIKLQRKNHARKRPEQTNNQEIVDSALYNNTAVVKPISDKTSPETSLPGTESEDSAKGQSPTSKNETNNRPPELGNHILRKILGDAVPQQSSSYFSNGPPPVPPSRTPPPQMNPVEQKLSSLSLLTDHDITAPIPRPANSNVNIAALDPEQQLRRNSLLNLFTESVTTPTRRQSGPVMSVSLDYEEQRRNSLLNLLQPDANASVPTAPPMIQPNGGMQTMADPATIHHQHQHQQQYSMQEHQTRLTNFLQHSAISIGGPDTRHSNDNDNNDDDNNGWFSMFAQPPVTMPTIAHGYYQDLPLTQILQTTAEAHNPTFPDNARRDSMFSLYSGQGYPTMGSNHVGFVGQGRPHHQHTASQSSTHSVINPGIEDISRKMSLLGLLSGNDNGDVDHVLGNHMVTMNNHDNSSNNSNNNMNEIVVNAASYFSTGGAIPNTLSTVQTMQPPRRLITPNTPNVLRASHENLLRLITASPPPQHQSASSGRGIDMEIQEQERELMRFLKFAGQESGVDEGGNMVNDNDASATASIDSLGSSSTIGNEIMDAVTDVSRANGLSDVNGINTMTGITNGLSGANGINGMVNGRNEYNGGKGYINPTESTMISSHFNNNGYVPQSDNRYSDLRRYDAYRHQQSEMTATTENVFLNFKFDVEKILAAM